jgi:hypothetical protein
MIYSNDWNVVIPQKEKTLDSNSLVDLNSKEKLEVDSVTFNSLLNKLINNGVFAKKLAKGSYVVEGPALASFDLDDFLLKYTSQFAQPSLFEGTEWDTAEEEPF